MTPALPVRYATSLRTHLLSPGEATLAAAYGLGRAVLSEGLGLLELSAAHHHALVQLSSLGLMNPAQLEASGAFFAEALSAFEIANRGYRDANAELGARNAELERAKAATEATARELESFSYSVSHDLRAPLRSIDGFSRALLEDNGEQLDANGKAHLARVREASARMSALVDDLLTLARVQRSELKHERVDLKGLAREVLERLHRADPQRTVEVVLPEQLVVGGDARLLGIALENLLSNAWKFTSKNRKAHIELGTVPGRRVYFVKDDGAGFDMGQSHRLFEAFQRLHTAQEFEGTGVGLATVARIVRRHHGGIWAESAPGRGATFFFTLGE